MADTKPSWLIAWMQNQGIVLWNVADLRGMGAPADKDGRPYPLAIAWAVPMPPAVMAGIVHGPNQAYADAYAATNQRINQISTQLAAQLEARGHRAHALAASERTDTVNIKGDFPHKTAATRAGLGWIGRHCQLITRPFGPWVRLGTVLTDAPLMPGRATGRSFCGDCTRCVDACPAQALKGNAWYPGIERRDVLDARACDVWKKTHYARYHNGHNCGICAAVCPYGSKGLKSRPVRVEPFAGSPPLTCRRSLTRH